MVAGGPQGWVGSTWCRYARGCVVLVCVCTCVPGRGLCLVSLSAAIWVPLGPCVHVAGAVRTWRPRSESGVLGEPPHPGPFSPTPAQGSSWTLAQPAQSPQGLSAPHPRRGAKA